MRGHEERSVSKIEVEIPEGLFDLCQHLAKHAREEPLTMLEIATVMGLADISNTVQRMCVSVQLVEYLEANKDRLGINAGFLDEARCHMN
jgi:hypothetical protein